MKQIYTIIKTSAILLALLLSISCSQEPKNATVISETAKIFPDYSNITIPSNIAPLNFRVEEKANKYVAVVSGNSGKKIIIKSTNQLIDIPINKWKKLLKSNINKDITIDIFLKKQGQKWIKYPTITNTIAADEIDNHIVFRHINAGYILWEKMGIYQRNIENFDQKPILLNDRTDKNCMHCHTFSNYNPEKMMLHLRRPPSGTLLYNNSEVKMLNTATPYTMSACVYPSWHPNGKIIAYSVNKIEQKFHSAAEGKINVYDKASDLVLYDIDKNMITTTPVLSTKNRENLPSWSPDGNFLYYISGPPYSQEDDITGVKYDLVRIAFDQQTNTWGKPDTLLKASETGMSITFPEISPDGKHVVFCMADQGYFTVYNPSSDLYIMDLETRKYSKLPINSDQVESFHYWSSNGKWLMFISKRLDGLYSRVYFTHIDENGNASKPFILPQKDPDYYKSLTLNFNRPVFVTGEVKISAEKLSEAAFGKPDNVKFDPTVNVDALSGASRFEKQDISTEHTN